MIGSHNTFTFWEAKNKIFNLFPRYWRCQCVPLADQLTFGVRVIDLRLKYTETDENGNLYTACHGVVNLGPWIGPLWWWGWLIDHCREKYIAKDADVLLRIVLESGNKRNEERFINDAKAVMEETGNFVWRFDIRKRGEWKGLEGLNNNDYYFDKGYTFAKGTTWEAPAHELRGYVTTKNWYKVSLKDEAKRINSTLPFFYDKDKLQEMIEDKTTLYLLDYATNQYE